MKKKLFLTMSCVMLSGMSVEAFASACTANSNISGSGMLSGDTCNGTDQITNTCSDQTPIGNAKEFIYSVSLGGTNSASFTVNGTGFNPYIALMNGSACNSLDTCSSNNAENTGNAGQNIIVGPSNNAAAGQYFLVITDPANAAGCGAFNLTVAGSLPVSLQKFSVE